MPSKKKTVPKLQAADSFLAEKAQLEKDLAKLEEEIRADEEELRKGKEYLKALIMEYYQRFGMQAVLRLDPELYLEIFQPAFGTFGDPVTVVHLAQNNNNRSRSIYNLLRNAMKGNPSP
ncbi:hypothetical protein DIS24_g5858 [Lasiodiplodia hormozganensis]|uniref:Uncharacterized protein n=1 Tax=Lasiodiplodia hormozganensis TaxID=869390 RepID=A0AA40CW61_9PEZI|nr:hypothetical protein DIS24_g5858 [Lasiodiplodia hormozganensis]